MFGEMISSMKVQLDMIEKAYHEELDKALQQAADDHYEMHRVAQEDIERLANRNDRYRERIQELEEECERLRGTSGGSENTGRES